MKNIHTHGGDVYRHPKALDFSSNCNPFGTPIGVKRAAAAALERVCHYPDVTCDALRRALEREEQVPREQIICGNGAADLIFGLVLARKPKKALLLAPGFAEYEQALDSVDCEKKYYYLKEEQNFVPEEGVLEAITEDLDMMFFCNPNNPTGTLCRLSYVKKIAEKCRDCGVFLVLDECFNDFIENPQDYTLKPFLGDYPHVFLLKAFTKKYAMAGLRLGYGLCASEETLEAVKQVMQPWNVSVIAQEAGVAALQEKEYAETTIKMLRQEREFLLGHFRKLPLKLYDSRANYIFFRGPEDLGANCLARGIYLRDCSNYEGLSRGYYRAAVRTRQENQQLISVLYAILQKTEE